MMENCKYSTFSNNEVKSIILEKDAESIVLW
jgi:hypothetical protein